MFLSLLAGIGLGVSYFADKIILAMDLRGMRDRKRKKYLRRYQRLSLRNAKRQQGAHDAYKISLRLSELRLGNLVQGMLAKECFDQVAAYDERHTQEAVMNEKA